MSAIDKLFEKIKKIIKQLTGGSVEKKEKYASTISPDRSPRQKTSEKEVKKR